MRRIMPFARSVSQCSEALELLQGSPEADAQPAISGFPSWDLGDRNPQLIEASIMLLHDEALGYRPYRYDHTEERATGDVDIHIDASVADRCARGSFGGLSRATHEKNLRRCTTWRQSRSRASWSRSTRDWRHRSGGCQREAAGTRAAPRWDRCSPSWVGGFTRIRRA